MSTKQTDEPLQKDNDEDKQCMDCVDLASYDSFPASDPPAWIWTEPAPVVEKHPLRKPSS